MLQSIVLAVLAAAIASAAPVATNNDDGFNPIKPKSAAKAGLPGVLPLDGRGGGKGGIAGNGGGFSNGGIVCLLELNELF